MSSRPRPNDPLWPNPEQRLLLQAALRPGEGGIAAFREWRSRIDPDQQFGWNVVRLLPLVYGNVHRYGVQDPLMGRLKGVYRRAWYETHQLFHRTAPVVAGLVARGAEVMLLKGAPLVLSYYRNHALRPMADLDVAVRESQVQDAIRVLEESGYRPTRLVSEDLLRFSHALQFVHPEGGQIDLHWHLLFEAGTDAINGAFWATAEPMDFMGTPVRQLDPTTLLLHVVVHGVRWNRETPIRWIPDSVAILRARGHAIEWDRMMSLARAHQLTRRLALGLGYLAETLDAPIPASVIAGLSRRPSLLERAENTVVLSDISRYRRSVWGTQWVAFTEYCRCAPPGGVLAFLTGYPEFLRFRWGLGGRREIVPTIWRGIRRRLVDAVRSA